MQVSNVSPWRRYPARTFSIAFELKGPAGLNTDCQSGRFASRYRSTVLLFVRPRLRRRESRLSTSARRWPCRGTARRCTSVGAGNYQEYTYQQYGVMTSMAGTSPAIDVRLISLISAPERWQAARVAVRGRQRR